MEDLRERIAQLEAALEYGNQLAAYRIEQLEKAVAEIRTRPDTVTRLMGPGALFKLIMAAVLLFGTLVLTGDFGAALKAARLGAG